MATPADELTQDHPLWGWGEADGPPRKPGAYAWFSDTVPPSIPTDELFRREERALLYVGIAPRAAAEGGRDPHRTSLAPRITEHYTGNAAVSALRSTLGCVLAEPLGLRLQLHGDGERFTWGKAGEKAISAWIQSHLRVSWVEHPRPWEVADVLFRGVFLPLNLNVTDPTAFHRELAWQRKAMEQDAAG